MLHEARRACMLVLCSVYFQFDVCLSRWKLLNCFSILYCWLRHRKMIVNDVRDVGRPCMAQSVSHRPLTAEAWVCIWVSPCGICDGLVLWHVLFRVLRFPLSVSFHPGSILISSGRLTIGPVGGRSSETVSLHRHEQQRQGLWEETFIG
jgi:hypothetical protein